MIVEKLLSLPTSVTSEGVQFVLELINNGPNDLRLAYSCHSVSNSSPHKELYEECGGWLNPHAGGKLQGFLLLIQGIENDEELLNAIDRAQAILKDVIPPQEGELPLEDKIKLDDFIKRQKNNETKDQKTQK